MRARRNREGCRRVIKVLRAKLNLRKDEKAIVHQVHALIFCLVEEKVDPETVSMQNKPSKGD